MEHEPRPRFEGRDKPTFGYDPERGEASIMVPGKVTAIMEVLSVEEPNKTFSIVTGADRETGETIAIELLDTGNDLEVTKVTREGAVVFEPVKH